MPDSSFDWNEFSPDSNTGEIDWAREGALASQEDKHWLELEQVKHENDKKWLRLYGWILSASTILLAIIFAAFIISWTWHVLVSDGYHWLKKEQLEKMQAVLFSGGMGAIISVIVRSQLRKAL